MFRSLHNTIVYFWTPRSHTHKQYFARRSVIVHPIPPSYATCRNTSILNVYFRCFAVFGFSFKDTVPAPFWIDRWKTGLLFAFHLVRSFVMWPCLCRALTTHVVGDHHWTVPTTLCRFVLPWMESFTRVNIYGDASFGRHHWTARDRQRRVSRFREQQMRASLESDWKHRV